MNAKVKKLNLTGLTAERAAVLECLKCTQSFELGAVTLEETQGAEIKIDTVRREKYMTLMAKVKFSIDFIERTKSEFGSIVKNTNKLAKAGRAEHIDYEPGKNKKPVFSYRDRIDYDNFKLIASREDDINEAIEKINEFNSSLYAIRADETKLKSQIDNMLIYSGFDLKFPEARDTKYSFVLLGTFAIKQYEKMLEEAAPDFYFKVINEGHSLVSAAAFGNSEDKEKALELLLQYGFNQCQYTYDALPDDLIKEWRQKLTDNYAERARIYNETDSMGDTLKLLKIYYDYLNWELESVNAQEAMLQTGKTFTLTGWYPAASEDYILKSLKTAAKNLIIETAEPSEDDIPPTLIENGKLVQPYTTITNMFSVPNHKERDPNKFVGFFFFLFFGVMMGDVGYGLVLLAVTLIALRVFKLEKGTKYFIQIVAMGSISAIIWGFFFGGFFGLEKTVITGGKEVTESVLPGLISPVNDAMLLLGLCLGLGVIHICFGLILKMAALFKDKKYFDGICDAGFMLLLFAGAAIIVVGMLGIKIPVLNTIGIILIIAALAGLILFGGRAKKGIVGKAMGGFGQIYGLINYISDILSYSRLFALCIAGGIIANVANQMALMMYNMLSGSIGWAAWIPGIIIALFLHLFNVALGILSIYVHNSRLQFVEFFGKFYTGGGHEFVPFGSKTKYVKISIAAGRPL